MSYTQIFVLPNGYTGSNLQATTILNGKNTAWSGISLEPGQNSSGQMGINIYGIDHSSDVTVYLPKTIPQDRMIYIKDVSGNANTYPITIQMEV